jgi:DNA-binding MarR family transcriptional regulator
LLGKALILATGFLFRSPKGFALSEPKPKLPAAKRDLPKSVTLSGRDLEEARRLLGLLSEEDDEVSSTASELARLAFARCPTRQEQLTIRAREILALRQKRAELFGPTMFGEPAWEMLLHLYSMAGAARQSMSRLAQLSGSSKATALRWIDYLLDRGLVSRRPHPTDLRTTFVELTDKGREKLEAYLADTINFTE